VVAGKRLHLRGSGPRDAPALIMLHGFGASLHTLELCAVALTDRFRVIRCNLTGFGPLPSDEEGAYSFARNIAFGIAPSLSKAPTPQGLER
jgi:pimeloyl-ACP methyl ester carboxylesterase